ncbi:c-type cytochrome [Hyphomicrobium sp.]|uniref:c-type cytochrome n=1 Tax=Hyphomicrobium sp. TaxID=82 RepID=UPI002E302803|nr:c-type cytochrome [Hyphomicrobium sp.]HEX2842392.1 c-type cytochrome [Hyphomicrobium sp.]
MLTRIALSVLLIACALGREPAFAADRALTVSFGEAKTTFTAAELLARADAETLAIPADVSYRRAMTYRAVPLLALIGDAARAFDTLEARASDGFVSQLPAKLVTEGASGGAVAWIAVEDPTAPWPNLPGRDASAGPFYLVWQHPERSNIGSEQWPFALAALTGVEDPVHRWPQLAVDPALPSDAAERRGQAAFIKTCLACHRLKGAGEGDIGPDLGQPMNVTRYMTPAGLRALIRDPKSVRTWPQQQMPGFDAKNLPDADLEALIAFLTHMATR